MGRDIKSKLRLALGSVKDGASIGKAMIQEHSHFSGIEIAVVRATGHDNNPPDDKYTHEILFLVANNSPRWLMIPFLADRLSRRLAKTRNHVVALKTLLLIHRLLRSGNRSFEQQLRSAHVSGSLRMSIQQFPRNNSNPCFSFLHNYAAYLEERMDWLINQAGRLEMIKETMDQYSTVHDVVFRKLPKCQVFLERVLDCESVLAVPSDNYQLLAQVAMSNTLKESFQVYMTFCEGVAALLNMLFDLTNKQPMTRSPACAILKKASQQSQELCYFYDNCKRSSIIGNRNLDYPFVEIIAIDHTMALEQLLKCSPICTCSGSSPPLLDCLNKKSDKSQTKIIKGNDCGRNDGKDKNRSTRYINSLSTTSFSSCTLETKISKVWVVFDEDDQPDESLACRL